jgi:uncharacterized integral membrane protein
MRLALSSFLKYLPLFFCSICAIFLFLDSLPGLLESLLDPFTGFEFSVIFMFLIFFLCVFLLILAAREIIQMLSSKQKKLQMPGTVSILLIVTTGFLLALKIPARLYFYTHTWEIEKALAQHPSGNEPFYYESMSFTPIESPSQCNEQYGFAYLPDRSKTRYEITHLHGKWYIYGGCAARMDVQ